MCAIKLTPKGINLLEITVLEGFLENPHEMQKAAKILNFKLKPLIHKYLRKYLEIEEDISRIRSGIKPIHNPLEYYTLKSRQR